MTSPAKNEYILITGASSGIGRALAAEGASRGHNLFLVALPHDGLDDFVQEMKEKHKVEVKYNTTDLTQKDAPQKIYEEAAAAGIRVGTLINNAGMGHAGNFHEMTHEQLDSMIHLNLRALTHFTHLFIRDMVARNDGHILNVGSLGAYTPVAYKSVYLASKSYVYYFTGALREEYGDTNLKFSVLMPAAVATSKKVKQRVKDSGVMGKITLLTPEYVARYTFDKMEKGKFTIMPGLASRAIFSISKWVPSGVLLKVTQRVFNKSN
ncbi:MAG: SDR family NAD(P)-dependent oxidoreductase [Bacteroidales bacterium]|nr:SDR family NAD(P)-dependent oxidoreductase [Bacteroidales bacterium]MDD3527454.1 SDR family NAD(P)-dependent oxidoreductase [Bacteroidales bacterium]MDD4176741.1 SDR family NAD(P)-dependent oxidoreductase [Bacteroidales bacterium]MDD4741016.1 SDR family NAD(P)-dependent oxidoreductase [Bacteroidales bacterium]NCU37360.1 SDR family NAD(P)-dependent oxidoreductase [Candidatus Falkowbacteria bacterium]